MTRHSKRTSEALTQPVFRKFVYCRTTEISSAKDQQASAIEDGHDPNDIIMEGRNAETLAFAIRMFRGKGGPLTLYGGMFVLADSSPAITDIYRMLKAEKIVPTDGATGENDSGLLLRAAAATINGLKSMRRGTKRTKLRAASGGRGKAKAAAERRDKLASLVVTCAIITAPELTPKRAAQILQTSVSSLRRHYADLL